MRFFTTTRYVTTLNSLAPTATLPPWASPPPPAVADFAPLSRHLRPTPSPPRALLRLFVRRVGGRAMSRAPRPACSAAGQLAFDLAKVGERGAHRRKGIPQTQGIRILVLSVIGFGSVGE